MKDSSDATRRFLLAAKHAEIRGLQQLSYNCKVVTAVKNVIHQLQRERGISNIFLSSEGEQFFAQRDHQIAQSDSYIGELKSQLKSLYLGGDETMANMRLLGSITLALQGIDYLPVLRQKVATMEVTALESTQAYCRLVAGLLSVVFEAADVASDPLITRLLVALFNFMQGKEFAGQERAWGALGFTETHFDSTLCHRLAELQAAQKHSFSVFLEFADVEEQQRWQEMEEGHLAAEVARLRTMIEQLADGSRISSHLSEIWYEITTRRIDEMHHLEEQITNRLLRTANQQVNAAEAELKNHHSQLQRLDYAAEPTQSPLTMLFDPQMPGLIGQELVAPVAQDKADSISGHRSFYDLLRDQAAYIKHMAEELEDAKRALTEQKKIDRAKLLMMQQFKISEDAAYRRLQKHAMDQNTRISDVAERVLRAVSKR